MVMSTSSLPDRLAAWDGVVLRFSFLFFLKNIAVYSLSLLTGAKYMICSSSASRIRFIAIRSRTWADITARKPKTCMVISGVIATIATTPKARLIISLSPQRL